MAEGSKAPDLGSGLERGVGSNPTLFNYYFYLHFSALHCPV